MKDEDFYKMISGMMEAREKERMLGIQNRPVDPASVWKVLAADPEGRYAVVVGDALRYAELLSVHQRHRQRLVRQFGWL